MTCYFAHSVMNKHPDTVYFVPHISKLQDKGIFSFFGIDKQSTMIPPHNIIKMRDMLIIPPNVKNIPYNLDYYDDIAHKEYCPEKYMDFYSIINKIITEKWDTLMKFNIILSLYK